MLLNEVSAGGSIGAASIAAHPARFRKTDKKTKVKSLAKKIRGKRSFTVNTLDTYYILPNGDEKPMKFTDFLKNKLNKNDSLPSGANFNEVDVEAKLRDAVRRNKASHDDTKGFVIEDADGKQYKIYVVMNQAEEFEEALGAMIDDEEMGENEVAEIVFRLRKRYHIVDVVWPTIEEDEEEDIEMDDGMGADDLESMGDEDSNEADPLGAEDDLEDEMVADVPDESLATSALEKVIQAMMADAEARKMDAEARMKEAEARIASAEAMELEKEVKKQEELLDLETHEKKEKDKEKEINKLAKLAKYRDQSNMMGESESFSKFLIKGLKKDQT